MKKIVVALLLSLSIPAAISTQVSADPAPATAAPAPMQGLAKQRALQLQRLREYRLAGKFTADEQGRPASVFRDASGRLCPMAHLIAASGRMDLVDQVARDNNRLQLADVTDGPLWDWMLTSGLTREEIIRIQGIMRSGFELEMPREQPQIMASTAVRAPSPQALRRDVVTRALAIERDLAMTNDVSLAVAASRLPRTRASVAGATANTNR